MSNFDRLMFSIMFGLLVFLTISTSENLNEISKKIDSIEEQITLKRGMR